ncbi:hypothetical protein [Actimicrobium antarcticum]|uniref:Nucleotide-diphospho-sugar transferase domain-containing protein n=1 Tax=Actimicrobium antarcticum TaxID=1051899 RepID=A0ABP7SK30_9BURK
MNTFEKNDFTVFTVCNLAYLPKALVLAKSLLQFEGRLLKIYIFDKKINVKLPEMLAEFIWIEDIGVPNLYQMAFKYDITEFSTSLKPFIALGLMEHYEKVIFLDPDTCLFDSLAPVLMDLKNNPIVLTPHYTKPHSDILVDSDIGMMRFGSFNLGFFAITKSAQGLDFLRWWSDRCIRFGYFETQFGLSTDQKWVSIAPCFFPDLYVSFNLGYNVAFWNVQERTLTKTANGKYLVNGEFPLIFFHFSSFDENNPERLTRRPLAEEHRNRQDLHELSFAYSTDLQSHSSAAPQIKYGFDYMSNGDYISPTLRRAYACVAAEFSNDTDPFDAEGPIGKFARRNYLAGKMLTSYQSNSFDDISSHKIKFKLVNMLMRIILRIVGPNRFTNFSRLLVFLSSYRQNRGMWKI